MWTVELMTPELRGSGSPLGPGRHHPVDRDDGTFCVACGVEITLVAQLAQGCPGQRDALREPAREPYRLLVNPERTVFVRSWPDGTMEVAFREDPSHTWGPPVLVRDESDPTPTNQKESRDA